MLKLLALELWNFRGIGHLKLDFTQRTTAFVGVNGVGKSAVLDALAIALSQLTWRINEQANKARPIAQDDIRLGAEFARVAVRVDFNGDKAQWALALNRSAKLRKAAGDDPLRNSDLSEVNALAHRINTDWTEWTLHKGLAWNLPLAVFYDVNRAVLEVPMRVREKLVHHPSEVYGDALDHGGADFKRFFIWFRNCEDVENERRLDEPSFRDSDLEAVRRALAVFTDFRQLRIRRKPLLRMTVEKQGTELNVSQLSDGERNMLALVGDLSRRLAILNPGLDNPNEGSGVVLIDEIDLHLHPGWQRTVVAKLESTFPNCQFVVSTHSPQVLGELKPESVMLLRGGALLGHAERSLGLSSGEVLEELMEGTARNAVVDAELSSIRALLDKDDITNARMRLDTLRAKVGDIPQVLELQATTQSLQWLEDGQA